MAKKKRDVEVEDEAPRRKKKSSASSNGSAPNVVTLDFSKDTSEGRKKFKEGDYPFRVKGVKMGHSKNKGTPQCTLTLVHGKDSKYAGDTITDNVYITEKALWRIRAVFAAAGKPIPKKKVKIDFKDLIGCALWATVVDDEYEVDGKSRVKSIIGDYLEEAPDEEEEDDDDEEEDDEEEDEDDELEDMDVDDDL